MISKAENKQMRNKSSESLKIKDQYFSELSCLKVKKKFEKVNQAKMTEPIAVNDYVYGQLRVSATKLVNKNEPEEIPEEFS